MTYFKVMSGALKDDAHLVNLRSKANERFAHLSVPFGKALQSVPELNAGDIGAVTKLKETLTGDTLAENAGMESFAAFTPPEPSIAYAILARSTNDENRLSNALGKMLEEDPSLHFYRDTQTHEFLLAGNGQQHLEIVVSRLKRRYGVEVDLKARKFPIAKRFAARPPRKAVIRNRAGGMGNLAIATSKSKRRRAEMVLNS